MEGKRDICTPGKDSIIVYIRAVFLSGKIGKMNQDSIAVHENFLWKREN